MFYWDILTLESGTDWKSQNVGMELPFYVAHNHSKIEGLKTCSISVSHCTGYGYMPSACTVLNTLMWRTQRRLANSLRTRTRTALYHLNNVFFFFDAFINITLRSSVNAGKCTGISQWLVNYSKHSLGWIPRFGKRCWYSAMAWTESPS